MAWLYSSQIKLDLADGRKEGGGRDAWWGMLAGAGICGAECLVGFLITPIQAISILGVLFFTAGLRAPGHAADAEEDIKQHLACHSYREIALDNGKLEAPASL